MANGMLAGAGVAPVAIKKWRMRAPIPTYGPNLLVNGDMETGDPPADWVAGSNTQLASVADARPGSAGSKALRMTASASVTTCEATRTFSASVGNWIRMSGWWNRGSSNNGATITVNTVFKSLQTIGYKLLPEWQQLVGCTARVSATPTSLRIRTLNTPAASGFYGLYDDMAVHQIDLASMFSARFSATANVSVAATIFRPVIIYPEAPPGFMPVQAGVVSRLDDPSNPMNFVFAYFYGANRIVVEKCVSGNYTTLIDDTTIRPAGSQLSLSWNGNVATVYCNGVQVGSPQTIADASIVGNAYHGLFSTHEGNKFFKLSVV